MYKFRASGFQVLTHVAALLPLALLVWDFTQGQLTANPIREIQLRTGLTTLVLLMLSLAVTPINRVSGIKWVLRLRRPLGLYAFGYASLHLLKFVGLYYRFDLALLREDIFEKRYAVVGFAAFLTLVLLAVTSTRGWVKRLGKNWERLHWLIYLTALLAVTHFILQAKVDLRRPLLYGAVVVLLLVFRLPVVGRAVSKLRRLGRKQEFAR